MDFEQIKQAIEIAGTAGTAVKNLGVGVEMIKSIFKSSDKEIPPEVKNLLVELAGNVADAKLANAELTQKLAELQEVLQKREAFQKRKARYKLVRTSAGEYLWQLKPDSADGDPIHYVCPVCMENERISIIQGGEEVAQCVPCDHWYNLRPSREDNYSEGLKTGYDVTNPYGD